MDQEPWKPEEEERAEETPAQSGRGFDLDQYRLKKYIEELRENQSLFVGFLSGSAAAAAGAALWAVITYTSATRIGWPAIGIGFLVGYAVRLGGRGYDRIFGYMAAILAMLGCIAGALLSTLADLARTRGLPLEEVIGGVSREALPELLKLSFEPSQTIFYLMAVYLAFRYSIRTLSAVELARFNKE